MVEKTAISDSSQPADLHSGGGVAVELHESGSGVQVGGATGFTDNGGAIIELVHVQLIFWGRAWANTPAPVPSAAQITNAVTNILSGSFMIGLAQYRNIGRGWLAGTTMVTTSNPPNSFQDSDVANMVAAQITAGRLPSPDADPQALYIVVMPQGTSASQSGFVGEHFASGLGTARNLGHIAWVTNNGTLDSITSILSHELVESCTDPEGSAILGNAGTCSQGGWCEIGDVCYQNEVLNGVTVQKYWSQQDRSCIVSKFPALRLPYCAVQFRGTVPANATHRWFTFNWPAYWNVVWTVVPTTVRPGAPEIRWKVQVQRTSGAYITYWIEITNLVNVPVDIEGRYAILGF